MRHPLNTRDKAKTGSPSSIRTSHVNSMYPFYTPLNTPVSYAALDSQPTANSLLPDATNPPKSSMSRPDRKSSPSSTTTQKEKEICTSAASVSVQTVDT